MNWFKKPPEKMTPEEAKEESRNSKKKKALSVLFFMLGMWLIIFIIFWLYNYTTKAPTDSDVYSMEEATIGVPYTYDFSWMSGLLEPESSGPYTYYLGTMNGFPPMGLILGPDGILKGVPTPTGKSSTFEVCVKDTAGKFDCLKVSLEVYTAATPKSGKTSAPTPTPTSKTNVISATGFSGKWVGTYTRHKVFDNSAWVCTYDATAPISICLTWQGQNFSGPINFPNGFKEASYPDDPTECPIPPHCSGGNGGQCSEVMGYTDSSGNLKLSSLTLDGSTDYAAGENSAVMNGNSMTVEYSGVTHSYGTTSNKGSFTVTKVSGSCK